MDARVEHLTNILTTDALGIGLAASVYVLSVIDVESNGISGTVSSRCASKWEPGCA